MSINFHFEEFAKQSEETLTQRVQFNYSPLNEVFRSLHILLNPRHHGNHMSWIVSSQEKMTEEFYNNLQYFRLIYELGTPSIFLPNIDKYITNIDEELNILKDKLFNTDSQKLIEELQKIIFLRENSFIPELAKGIEWAYFQLDNDSSLIQDLQLAPNNTLKRFFQFVENYRTDIFDDFWEKESIEEKLRDSIKDSSNYLHQHGFSKFINSIQSDRIIFRDGVLKIIKPFEEDYLFLNSDSLIFSPSYFVWPHIFVEKVEFGAFITYDMFRKTQNSYNIPELSKIFSALGDEQRLQILSYLKSEPNTTQGLERLMFLSPSSISRHLQILKAANIILATKHGKYVFYSIAPNLELLLKNFSAF